MLGSPISPSCTTQVRDICKTAAAPLGADPAKRGSALMTTTTSLVGERRAERRDDLVSMLAGADVDGDQLTDEEILFFSYLLILAGNETTRNAISGGLLAFFEHPEQWQQLRANPALMPLAVEEILRWTSPVMHMTRVATCDVRLHDTDVRAGERVCLWYPSANRDEAVFDD